MILLSLQPFTSIYINIGRKGRSTQPQETLKELNSEMKVSFMTEQLLLNSFDLTVIHSEKGGKY